MFRHLFHNFNISQLFKNIKYFHSQLYSIVLFYFLRFTSTKNFNSWLKIKQKFFIFQILNFEVAYIACVSFGILFIILVIFGGLIMCCCRSCCNSCGGNYIQSPTRTKSQWRICHTLLLLFLTVLILYEILFIFFIILKFN